MRYLLLFFIILSLNIQAQEYALVIHGGAGALRPEYADDDRLTAYERSLKNTLEHGKQLLESGATSLQVVEQVIMLLENDSLFNAGKGSVLTATGTVECDASIMDGATLEAGAVAGVGHIKNPIISARLVKDSSNHVLLTKRGAEEFALEHGVEQVPNSYFITAARKKQLWASKHGTVGAVALDKHGNIAAGTSTGGMSRKAYGRVGDSPIIGAGTYADNETCGISCTGHGEFFIRHAIAYDISAHMRYGGATLEEAADHAIHTTLSPSAGAGGVIGLDKEGNIVMTFNTPSMLRGYVTPDEMQVAIFK